MSAVERHVFRVRSSSALAVGARHDLDPSAHRHLTRVARRAPGDRVDVIDRDGFAWPGELGDGTVIIVGPPKPAPARVPLTLLVGLTEWTRLETLVRMATEVGVARIGLYAPQRSVRRANEGWPRRRERLLRIADSALAQSGIAAPPDLDDLITFDEVIARIVEAPAASVAMLDPRGVTPLGGALTGALAATLVVGGATGCTREEVSRAESAGALVCTLGGGVLRTETAAVVAMAIVASELRGR